MTIDSLQLFPRLWRQALSKNVLLDSIGKPGILQIESELVPECMKFRLSYEDKEGRGPIIFLISTGTCRYLIHVISWI